MGVHEESSKFCSAVIDSFEGACTRILDVRSPEVSGSSSRAILWLLADHLLLLIQAPVYLTFCVKRSGSDVSNRFSTLSDQDRTFFGLPLLAEEDFSTGDMLAQQDVSVGSGRTFLARGWALDRNTSIRDLLLDPEIISRASTTLVELAAPLAAEALEALPRQHPPPMPIAGPPVVDEAEWQRHIKAIRRRFDPILQHWSERRFGVESNALFQDKSGGAARLFLVTRQPITTESVTTNTGLRHVNRATYDYTARIIWTEFQAKQQNLSSEDLLNLELPLGVNARGIADSGLASGVIDFGFVGERSGNTSYRSREHYPSNSGSDSKRKNVEDSGKIYGSDAGQQSIFYVPIHIGGIPWLSVFSFHTEKPRITAMWRRYRIYRDVIPILAEQLSSAVMLSFADSLADVAQQHLSMASAGNMGNFCTLVTTEWSRVSMIFPFGSVRLSTEPSSAQEHGMLLHGVETPLYVHLDGDNHHVAYRLLIKEKLCQQIERELNGVIAKISTNYRSALLVLGHYLGGLMQESAFWEVESIVEDDGFSSGSSDSHEILRDLVRFAASRFAIVSGLGEATRMGKGEGGVPKEWISECFENNFQEITESVVKNILFYLVPVWKLSKERWTAEVVCGDERWCLHKDLDSNKGPKLEEIIQSAKFMVDLPPFDSAGNRHSGTVAVSLGLAELIRNAASAVTEDYSHFSRSIQNGPVLRVVIETPVGGQIDRKLRVVIGNYTRYKPEPQRMKSIKYVRMLEESLLRVDNNGVTQTTYPTVREIDEQGANDYYWVEATWTYDFGQLADSVQCII